MFSIRRQLQLSISIIAFILILLISGLTFFWVNRSFNQNRLDVASSYLLQNAAAFDQAIAEIAMPANMIETQINSHYEALKAQGVNQEIDAWLPYFDKALTLRDFPKGLNAHIDFYTLDKDGLPLSRSAHYEAMAQGNQLALGRVQNEALSEDALKALKIMVQNGSTSYWHTQVVKGASGDAKSAWAQIRVFYYYNQPVLIAVFSGNADTFKLVPSKNRSDQAPKLGILSQSGSLIYTSSDFDAALLKTVASSSSIKDGASGQTVLVSRLINSPKLILSHVLSNTWQIVYIYTPKSWLSTMGQELGLLVLLIVVFAMLLSLLGKWAFRRFDQPLHRLEALLEQSQDQALLGMDVLEIKPDSKDEIQQLMAAYVQLSRFIAHSEQDLRELKQSLETQAQLKTNELRQTNALLTKSIEDIERQSLHLSELHEKLSQNVSAINVSRRELLNLEKMSSLKYLVSGIAHELNTPIGNAITIATYLDAEIDQLLLQLKGGQQLQKHKLTDSVKTIRISLQQLLNNLQQGLSILTLIEDLVISETDAYPTLLDIPAFIELMAQTYLQGQPKPVSLVMKCTLTEPFIMTDPEKIRQILMPLLENSLTHGFKDLSGKGVIQIGLYSDKGHLVLEYSDNGRGVNWQEKQHILTPFYSSDFGLRKGLGLNFAYNIVTQYYKGHLSLFDAPLGGLGIRCDLDGALLTADKIVTQTEVSL